MAFFDQLKRLKRQQAEEWEQKVGQAREEQRLQQQREKEKKSAIAARIKEIRPILEVVQRGYSGGAIREHTHNWPDSVGVSLEWDLETDGFYSSGSELFLVLKANNEIIVFAGSYSISHKHIFLDTEGWQQEVQAIILEVLASGKAQFSRYDRGDWSVS